MTKFDLPADETDSINSSLLSQSCSTNSSTSNRSLSSRDSFAIVNIGPFHLHVNHSSERALVSTATIPSPIHQDFGTLDAILRNASGAECLETMTYIQMRVSSDVFGLHQMHIFLPNLVALNLHSSALKSLRHLGYNLKLKYLNVSRCGLKSFDGISGFECVEHLVADDNEITNVMQLSALNDLQTLTIRGNKIEQLNAIGFLSMCHKLRDLDLTNNSVTQQCNYREKVKTILPALLILDGFACDVTAEQFVASDVSSSLSSESSKDLSIGLPLSIGDVPEVTIFRPHSCNSQLVNNVSGKISKRPLTAETISSRLNGNPVVGNIVNRVRRNRQSSNDQPEILNTLLASSSSLSSLAQSVVKNGSNNYETNERHQRNTDTIATSNALIAICRKWRESSRHSRSQHNS